MFAELYQKAVLVFLVVSSFAESWNIYSGFTEQSEITHLLVKAYLV